MAKDQFILNFSKLKLTQAQRKVLNTALHNTVTKKLKLISETNVKPISKTNLAAANIEVGVTANLKVTFTEVNPQLSILTATYNGVPKSIRQSDTIIFDNVKSGKKIKIQGNSLGLTTITIDIDADPTQMNFAKGKINGEFFIN
jgi:hypothetical protein